MELIQRLAVDETGEYLRACADVMTKYPGSCDTVWMTGYYGYPTLEKHREYAESMVSVAENFKKKGIRVSMQFSNTIGHGDSGVHDRSGLIYEGSQVQYLVGHDGTVAKAGFCWRGKLFAEYLRDTIQIYAKIWKPESIWVDDDFRARNHAPIQYGCFCESCIKEFNQRYGSAFTRKDLVEEILHGDLVWRERFIQFTREGFHDLMLSMSRAVHEVSPDTYMALQHGAYGAYTGHGLGHIFDAMKEGTGKNPMSRPGGGGYRDHDPENFFRKGEEISWQNSMLPDYVTETRPEIESVPMMVFGKAPAGTAFEATHYFACGSTGMSFSMIRYDNEPLSWHEKEFELLAKMRPYWTKMVEYNRDSYQAGLHNAVSTQTWRKKLREDQGLGELSNEHFNAAWPWMRDGIPISYDRQEETAFLLHSDCVTAMTDEEIQKLLEKPVFTDGETIAILTERGFDFGVIAKEIPEDIPVCEVTNSNPINGTLKKYRTGSFVMGGGKNKNYALTITEKGEAEVLANYVEVRPTDIKNYDDAPISYGIAEAIVKTSKGAKWAVFGYSPWKGVMSFAKREQILNAVDAISDCGLCARILTPIPAALQPRKNRDGKVVCVSVTNCTVGESGEVEVIIRNPAGEHMSYMSQYNGSGELAVTKKGDDYHVTIPNINPWSVLTIFIEE